MEVNFSDMADISVEVEALNIDGIKQNLLDYVENEAKIDIEDSVEKADKSARDAEDSATAAASSATQAYNYANQTSENLGHYYTKEQVDIFLTEKQNTIVGAASTVTLDNLTADKVLCSDINGKINTSSVTGTELGYLSGVTSGVQAQLSGKADTSLSNLSSAGQMVIDSQNGTISNCILEIPQNIKLEISGGTITLKAGSTVVDRGSTYATVTTTQDTTLNVNPGNYGDRWLLLFNYGNMNLQLKDVANVYSGSTFPESLPNNNDFFYNTTDKIIYLWRPNEEVHWYPSGYRYPLAVIQKKSSSEWQFVKDSNGNDMIFNGMGFVGHHIFVMPDVMGYASNGINVDGSLASVNIKNNALRIIEMTSSTTLPHEIAVQINKTLVNWSAYKEVIHDSDADYTQANVRYYIRDLNLVKMYRNGEISVVDGLPIVSYFYTGANVTDFTPRQCVRTATVEMLDKKQDTLTFDSAPTSASTNPVTSGGVYTALSGKVNTATTLTGYGITDGANTALSNLSADGQMIVDSVNGTISNCVLEIPQNIKLELNNNVLTLKAGSVITLAQSTYATITTTVDKTYDVSSSSNSTYFLFIDSSGMYLSLFAVATAVSGATDSLAGTTYHTWFDTTNKVINRYTSDASTPSSTLAYPLCVIIKDSNGVRFAKDSNGNDMIFNGACFIGHHAVVYPNVKGLIPDGLNVDGSLKSTDVIRDSLYIRELTSGNFKLWCMSTGSIWSAGFKGEVNNINDVPLTNGIYYVKNQNVNIQVYNNTLSVYSGMICADYTYDGTTVTDFTIRQPVRTATVEMLDKVTAYRGTYDSSIQYYEGNIVKYTGSFYEALQNNINVLPNNTVNWIRIGNDNIVKYAEKSDNVEYPIGLTNSSASGSGYSGYINFTTQNKPTINASTGVITATGGIIGKTEAAGDNSTKYATTAFVNGYLASITGYDATKTQTLKNVSGTLTWVDD